jgi:hypothetical protein
MENPASCQPARINWGQRGLLLAALLFFLLGSSLVFDPVPVYAATPQAVVVRKDRRADREPSQITSPRPNPTKPASSPTTPATTPVRRVRR